jgi:putative endopeptidase
MMYVAASALAVGRKQTRAGCRRENPRTSRPAADSRAPSRTHLRPSHDVAVGASQSVDVPEFCMRIATLVLVVTVVGLSAQQPPRSGIDTKAMDLACAPCEDFWRYANGGWLDSNPLPASRPSWGPGPVLTASTRERLRQLLESAAEISIGAPAESNTRKMGDLYASCMDTETIAARGLAPVQPDLDRIAAIQSREDLVRILSAFQRTGRPFGEVNGVVVGPFRVTSDLDPKNPERVIAQIVERDVAGRSGTSILSLPDRAYYLKDDALSRTTREAFLSHAAGCLN